MNEIKSFSNFKELGAYLKKNRRERGEKINNISAMLLIKQNILKDIEEGNISKEEFLANNHIKGFLNTYIKYLKLEDKCKTNNLYLIKKSSLRRSKFSLEISSDNKKKMYGSLIILSSLIMLGMIYIYWNKNTYYILYKLGNMLD